MSRKGLYLVAVVAIVALFGAPTRAAAQTITLSAEQAAGGVKKVYGHGVYSVGANTYDKIEMVVTTFLGVVVSKTPGTPSVPWTWGSISDPLAVGNYKVRAYLHTMDACGNPVVTFSNEVVVQIQ